MRLITRIAEGNRNVLESGRDVVIDGTLFFSSRRATPGQLRSFRLDGWSNRRFRLGEPRVPAPTVLPTLQRRDLNGGVVPLREPASGALFCIECELDQK